MAILTNLNDYPTWNPFIKSIKGNIKVGNKITARIEPPNATGTPAAGGGLKDEILGKLFEGEEGTKSKNFYGKNPDIGLGKDGNILIKPRDGVKKVKCLTRV